MKIYNTLISIFRPNRIIQVSNEIPSCPIDYDPNNVTREEFRQFVRYLAKYGINRTFREPDRFVTEAERAEKKAFSDRVRYLAQNGINTPFIG